MRKLGEWVSTSQEAIYGTRGGPYLPTEDLVSTHKENKIYLYLLENPGTQLTLPLGEGINITRAYLLKEKIPLTLKREKTAFTLTLPELLPDEDATVVILELDIEASGIEVMEL